jgi:hypothetical protein
VTNSTFASNISYVGAAIFNAGKLTVTNSGFSKNSGFYGGGTIFNNNADDGMGPGTGSATVSLSTFTNNVGTGCDGCGFGDAIANGGTMSVTTSTFSGNSSNQGEGGAIANGGTMTVTKSSFIENSNDQGSEGHGGAIVNDATLTIINSTFYGNRSTYGGAIYNDAGSLTVISSTFANDSAGDAAIDNVSQAVFKNTILADANPANGLSNCAGAVMDGGYNISDDSSCNLTATGSQNNTNPMLDPNGLQNNGGPTETIALVIGSPAIDVIPLASCTNAAGQRLTTDQRGEPRPGAGETNCDIGAYEIQE